MSNWKKILMVIDNDIIFKMMAERRDISRDTAFYSVDRPPFCSRNCTNGNGKILQCIVRPMLAPKLWQPRFARVTDVPVTNSREE